MMSHTHPRVDICDYYANLDAYGLGKGIYPKEKAPSLPLHPFCRCKLLPKYAIKAKNAKLNKNAPKDYISSLALHKQVQILGSYERLNEFKKGKSILAIYNANKPERYKVKTLKELTDNLIKNEPKIWQKNLDKAIDEILINKNIKAPIKPFEVGRLNKDIVKKTQEILQIEIETKYIIANKRSMYHIRPERKGEYNQDLRIDEMRQISKILNDKTTSVSVDTKKRNIIFWFIDVEDKTKINKIVVDLNYKLDKIGIINYTITTGKIEKRNYNEGEYIKIR